MFTTHNSLKEFIISEDVKNIDIRAINMLDNKWYSISLPANSFTYRVFEEDFSYGDLHLSQMDISRSFIDIFMAHKTLVFLTELQNVKLKESAYQIKHATYNLGFVIISDGFDNMHAFASALEDTNRDFIGEIVSAIQSIGVKIDYFHKGAGNFYNFVISIDDEMIKHVDNIQKVKYAITMVARAYHVDVRTNTDFFAEAYSIIRKACIN